MIAKPSPYASGMKSTCRTFPRVPPGGGGSMIPDAFRISRRTNETAAPTAEPTTPRRRPSSRKTVRICPRSMPIARSVPISRVLSKTDIVIVFAAARMTTVESTRPMKKKIAM